MKTLRLIFVGAVLIELSLFSAAQAQVYSARRLTRRVAPPQQTPQAPADAAPAPAVPTPPPAVAPAPVRPTPVVRVQPPVDPEKAKAAKEEARRKTVEFQKKRAEEGSESAQYELGVRYLKGDGVEKDEATGRKWLEQSAKNGSLEANKKLEELNKTSPADKAAPAAPIATAAKQDKEK